MLFEITEDGHILTITEDLPGEAERSPDCDRLAGAYGAWLYLADSAQAGPESAVVPQGRRACVPFEVIEEQARLPNRKGVQAVTACLFPALEVSHKDRNASICAP